ncbi:MAG: biotin/lipoyl-containing protein [Candidatus Neomarinimicrobiota bacterium]
MKTYKIQINGKDYTVDIESLGDESALVKCNGNRYDVTFEAPSAPKKREKIQRKTTTPVAAQPVSRKASGAATAAAAVKAPIPGLITAILVKVGDSVENGQVVAKMEAMKMENNILASTDSLVKEILVKVGDSVLEGDVLMDMEGA